MANAKRLIHAVVHGNALTAVAGIQKPVAVVESSAMWLRDINESVIVERKRSKLQNVIYGSEHTAKMPCPDPSPSGVWLKLPEVEARWSPSWLWHRRETEEDVG